MRTFQAAGRSAGVGPGRGWVYVRAGGSRPRAIVEALERGEFYASTGVELASYEVTATAIAMKVKADDLQQVPRAVHRPDGRVLAEQTTRGELHLQRRRRLRARQDPRVERLAAWTQPVPVGASGPKISE